MLGQGRDERVYVSDLHGLGFRHPFLGLAMTLFMLSLGGIPPMAGFMGKLMVFGAAVDAGLVTLAIVGVVNSVISVFYYLRITVALYMREPDGEPVHVSWGAPVVVAILLMLAATVWLGVQADGLWATAQDSVRGLL
jgi:NADH-quinone oxidoreductase subunit N